MKVTIIGNGVWGNALYSVLKNNSSNVSFAKKGVTVGESDIIVLSLPTQSIRESLQYIPQKKNLIIINTAKGIEQETHLLPHQIVRSVFGEDVHYFTLIGPSFAKEVLLKMPTIINLGYKKRSVKNIRVQQLFQTDYFSVKLTRSVEPLEISAAFKNIYAIVCGLSDGLGYGINTRVRLIISA